MPLLIVGCLRRKTTSGEAVHGNGASFARSWLSSLASRDRDLQSSPMPYGEAWPLSLITRSFQLVPSHHILLLINGRVMQSVGCVCVCVFVCVRTVTSLSRGSAVAEGPRDSLISWNLVNGCTTVQKSNLKDLQ